MISLVIPARNAEATLGEQLAALAAQSYDGDWEVIVADNGSTDRTCEIALQYEGLLPGLRVLDASASPGAAAARNAGARVATGRWLAFCDADDVVARDWLAALAEALEEHDFVAGALDHDALSGGETWFGRSFETSAPMALRFLPYALSCNMGVRRDAFLEVGGFPEDLAIERGAAGEDVALSFELQLHGCPLHFAPGAVVAYRHRTGIAEVWRQYFAYGYSMPVVYKRYRSQGAPAISRLNPLRDCLRLVAALPRLRHRQGRLLWIRIAARRWGRLLASLRERVWYL